MDYIKLTDPEVIKKFLNPKKLDVKIIKPVKTPKKVINKIIGLY